MAKNTGLECLEMSGDLLMYVRSLGDSDFEIVCRSHKITEDMYCSPKKEMTCIII